MSRLFAAAGACAALLLTIAVPAQAAPGDSITPIQHLVVIFDENVSFDHYFATYPNAPNPAGQPAFIPSVGTPIPDNLASANLLTSNPNGALPARMDRSQSVPCDQDHGYGDEQKAWDGGLMDKFVTFGSGGCTSPSVNLNYFDGNTVTALWNYANNFAMSDAFRGTVFGPSTPGAINLISGNTNGVTTGGAPAPDQAGSIAGNSLIADPNPENDDCGAGTVTMTGRNIGDLMNAAGMTWGWFEGGFKPTTPSDGVSTAACAATHNNTAGGTVTDYVAHHEPFQYYVSTRNQHHLPPTSVTAIGTTDQANHQYDLSDFDAALAAGNLPKVSYLKAAAYQDGHAGYSGPIDEQAFVIKEVNAIMQSSFWDSTAIIVTYDDSDGWYDHKYLDPVNSSATSADALKAPNLCDSAAGGVGKLGGFDGRCGYGPRLPFILISPYAKKNYIDHTTTDHTSILRFIEDNWGLGQIGGGSFDAIAGPIKGMFDFGAATRTPKLIIDPASGNPVPPAPGPTPTPTPTPSAKPSLKLGAPKRAGKTLRFSITLAHFAKTGKITVRVTVKLGTHKIGTGKATAKLGKAKFAVRAKQRLKAGTYKLSFKVTQDRKTRYFTKRVRVR